MKIADKKSVLTLERQPVFTFSDSDWPRIRAYLKTRAEIIRLSPKLQVRFDESDLVQETLVRVNDPNTPPCRGQSVGEQLRWLDEIMTNTFIDLQRKHTADKRGVQREHDMQQLVDSSLGVWAESSTQSPVDQAMVREQRLQLAVALQELSYQHREVILARDFQELPLSDIAQRLNKSVPTISRLYRQALEQLKHRLQPPPTSEPGPET